MNTFEIGIKTMKYTTKIMQIIQLLILITGYIDEMNIKI